MGWYADGTGWDDRHGHDLVGMGDFAPFLVAYNEVTLGTGTWTNSLDSGAVGGGNLNNHWGIGLLGNHAINDDIRFNYGLGYFGLVSKQYVNQSKNIGFEVDLGATFQILDSLSFETQFGYMFNGSAYKAAVNDRSPKDTFAWANVLAVTF
jgi:hypothetical protein